MSEIKAVIFDLDGTLYNYNKADDAACEALGRYVSQHFGMDPGTIKQEIRECWDIQNDRIGFICGATHNRLIRSQVICERNGWPVFPHALNMAKTYWGAFLEGMVLEDGIRELLAAHRKTDVDIALGSNMTSYIQYLKLMQIGLEDCFDHITLSEETGIEKPEKEFYEMCARKSYLRFDASGMYEKGASAIEDISEFMSSCLFIGDTPKMDYFGPIRAGMCACLYLAGNPLPEGVDRINAIENYKSCVEQDGVRLGGYYLPFYRKGV